VLAAGWREGQVWGCDAVVRSGEGLQECSGASPSVCEKLAKRVAFPIYWIPRFAVSLFTYLLGTSSFVARLCSPFTP